MDLKNDYQVYSEDDPKDNGRFNLSRLCSCLYLYTIGSCRYFNTSLSRKDRIELRMLWESQDGSIDTDTKEDQWKRKTRKADCKMRKRIRYHFKDHIKKWRDKERPRFPWKMILHFLLVIVVSIQVWLCTTECSVDVYIIGMLFLLLFEPLLKPRIKRSYVAT